MKELSLDSHDLALLAHMAQIGTQVVHQQLLTGAIPEENTEAIQMMVNDANGVLMKMHEFFSDRVAEQEGSSDLSEVGAPNVIQRPPKETLQ